MEELKEFFNKKKEYKNLIKEQKATQRKSIMITSPIVILSFILGFIYLFLFIILIICVIPFGVYYGNKIEELESKILELEKPYYELENDKS